MHHCTRGSIRIDGKVVELHGIRMMIIKLDAMLSLSPVRISPSLSANTSTHNRLGESIICWAKHLRDGGTVPLC